MTQPISGQLAYDNATDPRWECDDDEPVRRQTIAETYVPFGFKKCDVIVIGGRTVVRTVAGALGRLELETAATDARLDVDFLRAQINRLETERDVTQQLLADCKAQLDVARGVTV